MSVFRRSRGTAAFAGSLALAAAAVSVTGGTYAWFTDSRITSASSSQTGTLRFGEESTSRGAAAVNLEPGSALPQLSASFSNGGSLTGKVRLALTRDDAERPVLQTDLRWFHLTIRIERSGSDGRAPSVKEFEIDLDRALSRSFGPNGPAGTDAPFTRTDDAASAVAPYFELAPGEQQRVTVTGYIDPQARNSLQGRALSYRLTATLMQLQAPNITVAE